MKISELNVKDFLSRNTDAEANSYLILNYGENDTEPAVTQRISLKELSNMIINNNKLLQYTPDNKNLTSINYASNAYNKTPAIGQYIDTTDRSVLDSAVTAVSYDGTNKKFTRSIRGGTAGDIVSVSTLKTDMALNNVNNTSDANKPISTATQTALDGKVPITRTVNGHALSANITVSKGDVSLGNVDNTADIDKPVSTATQAALNLKMNSSARGAANGVASLDENSKIPAAQLPSYVDDIIEGYYHEGTFYNEIAHTSTITGESGKIYVDLTENGSRQVYRWSGNAGYVAIPIGLALGETSSTAYAGDRGAAAYTHAVTNKGIAKASGLYKITTNSEGHVTAATAVTKSDITSLGIPGSDTTYEMDGTYNASTNKVATVFTVTNAVSGLYTKPSGGIPASDLAETYLTQHQSLDGLAPIESPEFTTQITIGNTTLTEEQLQALIAMIPENEGPQGG